MYCYSMLCPPSHHREEDRRRHAFGKVSRPVHDRLGPHRSGQRRQPAPVRLVAIDRSDQSHRRPVKVHSPRQVYRVKKKKDEVHTTVDPEKAKADGEVQICNIKVDVSVASTRPRFLINWSILLSRGRSWIMIMRPAAVIQHQSTFNQGGVLQG